MRNYKSRLQEVEERRSIRSALLFGGLTVVVIILLAVFGLTLFSKFINLFNNNSKSNSMGQDVSLLAAPNLAPIQQYTNKDTLVVQGTATGNAMIKIYVNTSPSETTANSDGSFSLTVTLNKGANMIYAQTVDSKGNTSKNSSTFTINFVNKEPSLTVSVPSNNQSFYGQSQQNLSIQGSTDPGNTLTINDHVAILDTNGKFNFSFELQNGDNNLKIISTDPAGNKKEIDLKVTFNP